MNWKRYFSTSILDRGFEYYRRERVKGLYHKGGVYKAFIVGTIIYHTEIKIMNNSIVYMKCNCPHFEDGHYCKHLAAMLYAIEEEGGIYQQEVLELDKKIRPFQREENTYQYFDMGRIAADLEVEESKVEAAKKLIGENKIFLENFRVEYHHSMNGGRKYGIAIGFYEDEQGYRSVSCQFDRNHIIRAECAIPRCMHYYYEYSYGRDFCVHQLALLFLIDEHLKKYNPGDATDIFAYRLISGFRSMEGLKIVEQQGEELFDFRIEPVLEKYMNEINLTLKAGTEKLYVVKNIAEFISLYDAKDIITFGTKTEIDLAKHRINPEEEELFQYVRQIVKDEQSRIQHSRDSYGYYYDGEEIKQRIALYGRRLDLFFDLYEGKIVSGTDKSGRKSVKTSYLFKEGKPNLSLTIEKDIDEENVFHGIQVHGKIPDLLQGERCRYYFAKDAFCKVSEDVSRTIEPLLELEEYGKVSFRVGRKSLSEFYYHVLPMLKENVKIKDPDGDVIQEFIPPNAVYTFNLDVENGEISCKANVQYGEENYSLLDNLREEQVFEWFRNLTREKETLAQVRKLFPIVNMENDELYSEQNEDSIVALLDGGIERLMMLGEVNTTDRFRKMNIRTKPKIKIGVSMKSDIMNLSISSDDIEQEELLQLLKSYQRKKKYYRLKNGDLISISEQDMDMLKQLMESMQLSPKDFIKGNMKIPMYRALYLNKMLEQSENIYLNRDKHFKNLIKEFKTVDDSEFEVPDSLSSIMRGYQVYGFKWFKTLEHYKFGGILADDMGLGKTLQAISMLLDAKNSQEEMHTLIVSPASLVYNWKEEFQKYAPTLTVNLVVGNQQERAEIIHKYKESDVLVTSYDLLKRDIAEYSDVSFTYQIIDEAQYIKNHTTAAAKSVKIINSKYRFALTGTPIENRLSELWSIFDYLMPGFLYGYETFRKELETPIVKYKDEEASNRLKKMVAPFILRRLKKNVLADLPDKLEEVRYAKLEKEQQKLYDAQVIHMKKMLEAQKGEDFQKNKLQVLAELTKIRQICCDPQLLFDKYAGGSAKREACMELIQSAIEGEHKILIFSQFTSMLELLEVELKKAGVMYYKITGETSKQKRVELVNAFNGDETPVFLISLKAGGTGLNLTGADVVIHYDPWWNQAAQNQATDRAHRIGQTRTVSVYKLIVKDTIEEKIVKMQESKKDLADAILSGENGSISQMSKEELMELLEG